MKIAIALIGCLAAAANAKPIRGRGSDASKERARLCAKGEVMACEDGLTLKRRQKLCFLEPQDEEEVGATPSCVAKPDDWVRPSKERTRLCAEGEIMACEEGFRLKFRKQLCFADGAADGVAPSCAAKPDDWVRPGKKGGKRKGGKGGKAMADEADEDEDEAAGDRERRQRQRGKGGKRGKGGERLCAKGEVMACEDGLTLKRRQKLCFLEPQDEEEVGAAPSCVAKPDDWVRPSKERTRLCAEGEIMACEEGFRLKFRKQLCFAEGAAEGAADGVAPSCAAKPDDWVRPGKKGGKGKGGKAMADEADSV